MFGDSGRIVIGVAAACSRHLRVGLPSSRNFEEVRHPVRLPGMRFELASRMFLIIV